MLLYRRVVFSFELPRGLDHCHILLGDIAEGIIVLFGEGDFLSEHCLIDLNAFDFVQLDFLLSRFVEFGTSFIMLGKGYTLLFDRQRL